MTNKATYKQRLLIVGACIVTLNFLGCPKPEPPQPPTTPELKPGALLSDLEIVKVRLEATPNDYEGNDPKDQAGAASEVKTLLDLNFNPPSGEPAIIFFNTDGEDPQAGAPIAVRWEFAGLEEGHTVYITPKEGQSTTLFAFPDYYNGEPAFSLKLPNDTIYSGPAIKEHFDALYQAAQVNFTEGETAYVSWFYDVDVVDGEGQVVATYDPEVRIKTYP